jgi:hypothetical protein
MAKMRKNCTDLLAGKDQRDFVLVAWLAPHLRAMGVPVWEHDDREIGLQRAPDSALRQDFAIYSQIRQEGTEVRGTQLRRVSLRIEEYVLFDPMDIGLFGTKAIVASANNCPHLVQKFGHVRLLVGGLQR